MKVIFPEIHSNKEISIDAITEKHLVIAYENNKPRSVLIAVEPDNYAFVKNACYDDMDSDIFTSVIEAILDYKRNHPDVIFEVYE